MKKPLRLKVRYVVQFAVLPLEKNASQLLVRYAAIHMMHVWPSFWYADALRCNSRLTNFGVLLYLLDQTPRSGWGMDQSAETRFRQAMMSHHEIMQRFKRLFGREMTAEERTVFFLPREEKLAADGSGGK
jgi:hypothetical protein